MATANIGDFGAALEFLDNTIQRGQPLLHQVMLVGCTEATHGLLWMSDIFNEVAWSASCGRPARRSLDQRQIACVSPSLRYVIRLQGRFNVSAQTAPPARHAGCGGTDRPASRPRS